MHQNGVHFLIILLKNLKKNLLIQVWILSLFIYWFIHFIILVYDDYKFLTLKELDTLGLSHLIGSDLLRAYMHGYFMDIRLYNQVNYIDKIIFSFKFYFRLKLLLNHLHLQNIERKNYVKKLILNEKKVVYLYR